LLKKPVQTEINTVKLDHRPIPNFS